MPESRPPILPPDEVFPRGGRRARRSTFVQSSLALDFEQPSAEPVDRTPRRDLPDPEPLVHRLAQAFIEVMAGRRPATQVVRFTEPSVYAVLTRRALVASRRGALVGRPALVRQVRVQEPADGVVEACAVVVHHDRVRAIAMRLAGIDGRWVVTDLQVG
ncbi:MAG TPA: Rv3235 family protein [Dermatophilaceae bacterium]|nr:Rv3235 family protein [Dermatophilaceae bacterium]